MPATTDLHPEERDLALPSGRLRARCWALDAGPDRLVVCVPGLSANAAGFDRLARVLAGAGHAVAALDLRGRGASETTPPGTYGWPAHARDVVDAAAALGAERFDVVGHSMGAYVAMQLGADRPDAARTLVLIDGAGLPEPGVMGPIGAGLRRLGVLHPSADAYVEAIRRAGVVTPWSEDWDRFYRYELAHEPDGQVRATTSLEAVLEDVEYGRAHPQDALWPALRGPVLLVRALQPLGDSGAFVLSAADAARFVAEVPGAELVEVRANHFGVLVDDATTAAIARFLDGPRPGGS